MGDAPVDDGCDKRISVAEMVRSIEAETKRCAGRVFMTSRKQIVLSSSKATINDGTLNCSSVVPKSHHSGTFSDYVMAGVKERFEEAAPSSDKGYQIANIPQIELPASLEAANMKHGSKYHTCSSSECTISQIVPFSESDSSLHNGTDKTFRYTAHRKPKHVQEKANIRHKRIKVDSNEKLDTSQELRNENDKSYFVGNSDSMEIEVDSRSNINPHNYWKCFMEDQIGPVVEITPLNPQSEIEHNCVRFVCMSDTHGQINQFNIHDFLGRVPAGDVLLHSGDFTLHGDDLQEYEDFNVLLSHLPHRIKLAIPGNHEVYLDQRLFSSNDKFLRQKLGMPNPPTIDDPTEHIDHLKSVINNATVLIDSMVEFCGIKIYGLPWVPLYGVYGFGLARGYTLLEKYNQIPAGIDILMSHGPALGFCDVSHRGLHVGCAELLNSVRQRIKPRYVVHGHIHEAYGVQSDGVTTFINASICDKEYNLSNDPIVFDYPLPYPFTREDFLRLNPDSLQLSDWDKLGHNS